MSFKQEKVIVIISEFVNDKREFYPITNVPVEKARFFYKDDDGLFKVMASSDYAVRTELNETRLYITNVEIKEKSTKFQVGYEINFTSSEYETSLPVLSVLVEMYNNLIEDSRTIFNYVKKQCFISDDKTTSLVLPNLPSYCVWCMGENGEMFALPVNELYSKFEEMLNKLKSILADYTESKKEEIRGATFFPHLMEDGTLSWTNDKNKPNPEPVNIKGPAGTIENVTASVNSNAGTPSVKVTMSGTKENRSFDLQFENLKGDMPVKGEDYLTPAEKEQFTTETIKLVTAEGNRQISLTQAEALKVIEQLKKLIEGNPETSNAQTLSGKTRIEFEKETEIAYSQYDDILKKYIEIEATEVVKDYLINLNNKDPFFAETSCYIKQTIPENVKKIKVTGKSASATYNYNLGAFYKADGTLISKFGNEDSTVYTDLELDIPKECSYILVNQNGITSEKYKKVKVLIVNPELKEDWNYIKQSKVEIQKTNKRITEAKEEIKTLKEKIDNNLKFDKVGYISTNPSNPHIIGYSPRNGFNTGYVVLDGYKYIDYKVNGNEYMYFVCYFDENKTFLPDVSIIGGKSNKDIVEIPQNAKYAVISTFSTTINNGVAILTNNSETFDKAIKTINLKINDLETETNNIKKNLSFDNLLNDTEFAVFKKFGLIGDSLSVGHTVSQDGKTTIGRNIYYSWGQYLARRLGNTCLNFGRSGVTSKLWLSPDEQYCYPRLIDPNNLCQTYIIALGANDADAILGSIEDVNFSNMELNADTEYGNYAKVINAVRTTAPKAPIFLFTLPYPRNTDKNIQAINNMIREFAKDSRFTNVFLVDLDADYNEFYKIGKLYNQIGNTGWHLTSLGYMYASHVNQRALSKVIADNYSSFQDVFLLPCGNTESLD